MNHRAGSPARLRFGKRNVVLLGAAVVSLGAGYALLAQGSTALAPVLLLERMGGERGLQPLIATLRGTSDFDLALRTTYQMTAGQFETLWQKDLRRRHGWLLLITSVTVFWAFAAVVLAALWSRRRRRDRGRREALNEGWVVPEEYWDSTT